MLVVACQYAIAWEDKSANYHAVRRLLANQDIPAGSLVVLPEMFATGFSMNVAAIAENNSGPTHMFLRELARQLQSHVVAGVAAISPEGRGLNQALTFDSSGQLVGRYTKMQPFAPGGEAEHYQAGDSLETFNWAGLNVAPLVCYDLRFPEHFRQAARQGAQAFVVIANWPSARIAHWTVLLKARAIENQAYVLGLNRCGSDPQLTYTGHSLLIDPQGQILADAGDGECVLRGLWPLEPLLEYRRQFPVLADMR